jgi:hypothetical protein
MVGCGISGNESSAVHCHDQESTCSQPVSCKMVGGRVSFSRGKGVMKLTMQPHIMQSVWLYFYTFYVFVTFWHSAL